MVSNADLIIDREVFSDYFRVEFTDHQFAAWLRSHDPNWKYERRVPNTNHFLKSDGTVLAFAIYNNAKCTSKIYVHKDFV